jgi:sec-independent protein translocase protein TatA
MFGLRPTELLLILLIVIVLFGAKKLPQLGQGLGEGLKSFRKSFRDSKDDEDDAQSSLPPRAETPEQARAAGKSATNATK